MLTCDSLVSEVEGRLRLLLESLGELFVPYAKAAGLETAQRLVEDKPSRGRYSAEHLVRCGVALELLNLATNPSISPGGGGLKESVMAPDHLMAHAIDQVIPLGNAQVIKVLATCISRIAGARAAGDGPEQFRKHLFEAAELLFALSACDESIPTELDYI